MKSSVEEIRERFDHDVERFSNLETGQTATIDAPLALDLIAEAASVTTPKAKRLLDVGCGAGNYSIKLLQSLPGLEVTLIDLSRPMLDRAEERLKQASASKIHLLQGDIRKIDLGDSSFDVIVAAAVLHHLRTDEEWHSVFDKFFRALSPGGSLWIFDLVESDLPSVQEMLWQRYGSYLESLQGPEYRERVFAYIEREDTPKSLVYQLNLMQNGGFQAVDVLHKHGCFAAFGGMKPTR